jgi:hypothetical protein
MLRPIAALTAALLACLARGRPVGLHGRLQRGQRRTH